MNRQIHWIPKRRLPSDPAPKVGGRLSKSFTSLLLLAAVSCNQGPPQVFEEPTVPPDQLGEVFVTSGIFGYKQVLQQYVKQPVGEPVLQKLTAYSLATLHADDEQHLVFQDSVCVLEMTDVMGAAFALTAGYYDNPPTPPVSFKLASITVGARLESDLQVETYGATLEDPLNDELPSSPDDPRVYDFDHDGKAGFTVNVYHPYGELWTVNRFVYSMDGQIYSPDGLAGLIYGVSENAYLYSSSALIPTDTQVWPSEEPGHNFYELVRLADDATCESLLATKDSLFSQ